MDCALRARSGYKACMGACTGVMATVRDVPEGVRDALAEEAREQGCSLQSLLLSVLNREAAFIGNRKLLADIECELERRRSRAGRARLR